MVTDEDRDYMYRVYASDPQARINLGIRRRLAPLMGNDRRRIELMNALLFSLPGTPVVYYGDEIGMGDNIYLGDRNGVRTPMQWSPDRNAGFSQANPQKLYSPVIIDPEYHYEALNVDAQQNNPHSLLWWMKHIIGLRRQYRAFGRGTLRFLLPDNGRVLAFVREHEEERILVVANLSRYAQAVQLDLTDMQGVTPLEMFGRTPFPQIGATPYPVTLSPYSFYWFLLPSPTTGDRRDTRETKVPAVAFSGAWEDLVRGDERELLEAVLPAYLQSVRWFRGKARKIASVEVVRAVPVPVGSRDVLVTLVEVRYLDADTEVYVLPLAYAEGDRARDITVGSPNAILLGRRGRWRAVRRDGGRGVREHAGRGHGTQEALAGGTRRDGRQPHPGLLPSCEATRRRSAPRSCAASSRTRRSTWATDCSSSCSARRSRDSIPTWSWGATSPTRPISAGCRCSPAAWSSARATASRSPSACSISSSPVKATRGPSP